MKNHINSLEFCRNLIEWHSERRRNFPWDQTSEPYKIYVSEIILQQTRTAQGLDYYKRFLTEFPSIQLLARAREEDVLRIWTGLGYYSRARNMHKTAQIIVTEYKGEFPREINKLEGLPGIGPYASRAIAAFAFKQKVAAVDGNLRRILSRLYATNFSEKAADKRLLQSLGDALVQSDADDWNRAMMNLASNICLPQNASCLECPLSDCCLAYKLDRVGQFPIKKKKITKRTRYFHYLLILERNTLLIQQRTGKDIWQGLYELPLYESDKNVEAESNNWNEDWNFNIQLIKREKRVLSHQNIELFFYIFSDERSSILEGIRIAKTDIEEYAFSKSTIDFLKEILGD